MSQELKSLNALVESIQQLEADTSIQQTIPDSIKDEDGSYYPSDLPEIVQIIQDLLCDCFITNKGAICFAMVAEAKRHNIIVRKGESDSFGWLSGYIVTTKGEIYFG